MKTQIHTADQPNSDITAFFLSCDRLDLLRETVQSFLETSKDQIVKKVIYDDSGNHAVFANLVEQYGDSFDIICPPENRGLLVCQDFMVSYCFTPYIFYVEDDWRFLKPGYLTLSKEILQWNRRIGLIDLSDRRWPEMGTLGMETPKFIYKHHWRCSPNHLWWIGMCGSPNLRRREDLVRFGRHEIMKTEWHSDRMFALMGLQYVFAKDAYVTHIGDGRSKMEGKRPTNEIVTPDDFNPLKAFCRLPKIDWYFMERDYGGPPYLELNR